MMKSSNKRVIVLGSCILLFLLIIQFYTQTPYFFKFIDSVSSNQNDNAIAKTVQRYGSYFVNKKLHQEEQGAETEEHDGDDYVTIKPLVRILMGIFTSDSLEELKYRHTYRKLLSKYESKICSLYFYIHHQDNNECELIYTFVLGGSMDPNAPTEIMPTTTDHNSSSSSLTYLAPQIPMSPSTHSNDFYENDMTFLNIRENIHDGKSQTWFYFVSAILDDYDFDYVMKINSNILLDKMDRFFRFVDHSLPPMPYNTRILAGQPSDKDWWTYDNKRTEREIRQKESYFRTYYSSMHLYANGTFYIVSHDLVKGIYHVALNSKRDIQTYKENVEDHDISLLIFLYISYHIDQPLKFVLLPSSNPFWILNNNYE